jgi:hypothetical protein
MIGCQRQGRGGASLMEAADEAGDTRQAPDPISWLDDPPFS